MQFLFLLICTFFLRSTAFVVNSRRRTSTSAPTRALHAATPSPPSSRASFEYQEMRIILDAMQRQGIVDLASPGKEDLERYVRSVARQRPASLLRSKNQLVGTTWRLVYSNDLRSLPPDATVYLKFKSESEMTYQLKFGQRTLGLNAISADCPWQLQSDTISSASQLTFVYDKIRMDAFGFKKIGTGLFGLLQGRSQTIYNTFFDGDYWIDLGNPMDSESSITVYVKVEDLDVWR